MRPTRRTMTLRHRGQERVERALPLQGHHVVATADVTLADEDLRKGHPPARTLDHLPPLLRIEARFDLGERDALLLQKGDGPNAVGAVRFGVDGDHGSPQDSVAGPSYGMANPFFNPRRHCD